MSRTKVAILFGGASEEHDVSVKSAMEIARAMDTRAFEPIHVGITKGGVWKLCEGPRPGWDEEDPRSAVISPDRAMHGLLVLEERGWRAIRLDVVFPVLHGRFGEDGAIQGLLELSGIPYVGCDVAGSAVCMDKSLAYHLARSAGIATPDFRIMDGDDARLPDGLAYPVFVKPARSGSSFGVTRVEHAGELAAAIADARQFDRKVLIERAVPGTEVGCAVLGDDADLLAGEVDQISLRHGLFRIHQEAAPETGSENATITVPADVPEAKRNEIRATAKAIYRALGCRGLARVDMFLKPDGAIVLNEVNTLPGFTAYSRYPRMMAAAGIDLTRLIDRSIALALGR